MDRSLFDFFQFMVLGTSTSYCGARIYRYHLTPLRVVMRDGDVWGEKKGGNSGTLTTIEAPGNRLSSCRQGPELSIFHLDASFVFYLFTLPAKEEWMHTGG